MRIGDHECSQCPNPFVNSLKIILVIVVMFGFIMMLIIFNIRKTKESEASILGKILMNYMHMVSTSFTFNIAFPRQFSDAFSPL